MKPTIQLFKAEHFSADEAGTLTLANDADPREAALDGVHTVVLQFPAFTDGRAFSQAFLLRRRLGFTGQIRAVGDVLVDQLQQMQRSGFTQAVLRADQRIEHGHRLLTQYHAFYQGDAVHTRPHFANA
ncbi:MAG: hypothetical protein C0443_09195 [Comamonadaceae bacterium]|nr:hypothetical protein [Comamonadaceae bacterium]